MSRDATEIIMSFISSIEGFFKHLFGGEADVVEEVITDIQVLYTKAVPVVTALSTVLTAEDALHPDVYLEKVVGVLNTFVTDAEKVSTWVAANGGLTMANLLQNAAVFALSFVTNNTILKDLQLAVQLAYNVYAALHPSTTGNSTVASLGHNVSPTPAA